MSAGTNHATRNRLSQVRWLEDNGHEHVGRCGNLIVLAPYGPPTVASPARFARWLEEVASEGGPAPALLVAFPQSLKPPGDDARPLLRAAAARIEPLLAAMALVVQGQGFFAAAQRAAAMAVFTFAGLRNHKVHRELDEGVAWLRPWLSPALHASGVAEQVRDRLRSTDGVHSARPTASS